MPQFLVPIITAIGTAMAGTALAALGSFMVTYAAGIATLAMMAGGLAYSSSQAKDARRKARDAYNSQQVDRLTNVTTTVAPMELVLGRVRKGGAVFFKASTGANQTTFLLAIALAGHEVDAVEGVYLNDQLITRDGSGNVSSEPYTIEQRGWDTIQVGPGANTLPHTPVAGTILSAYAGTGGPEGDGVYTSASGSLVGNVLTMDGAGTFQYQYLDASNSKCNVRFVLGTSTQTADARMMELFPALWTSAHRARGVAYAIVECTYDETAFPSGLPNVTAVLRGAKVYDPRTGLTAWTANPALHMRHVYQHPQFGKATITAEEDDRFITAANACDAPQLYSTYGETNLLTGPNAFDVSPWSAISATISGTKVIGADGTTTAERITSTGSAGAVSQTISASASSSYQFGVWLRASTAVTVSIFQTDNTTSSSLTCSVTPIWQFFSFAHTTAAGATTLTASIGGSATFSAGEVVDAWGATLSSATQVTNSLYESSLVVPFGAPATGVFDDLAQAMGGSWAFAGGQMYMKAGVYTSSVMSLTDADLAIVSRDGANVTQHPIAISVHRERAQKFNTANVTIWSKNQDYKQVQLTPLVGTTLVTRDGAELVQEMTFPAVFSESQALHIAGIMMRSARDPLTVQMPFKMRAYPLELFDTVDITLARYGWVNKTMQIVGREWTAEGNLSYTMKETAAAHYVVDAAFSSQGYAENTALPRPWDVPTIGALTVTSGNAELQQQSDGTVVSRMRVAWPALTDQAIVVAGFVEVQYRSVVSAAEWTSVMVSGSDTQVVIPDVQDANVYNIRARSRNSLAIGVWNTQVVHTVIGKTAAPPDFDFFTVMAQPDGTRQYNFGYNTVAAQPVDWMGAEIRYVSGTDPAPTWSAMRGLQDLTSYYTHSPVELNSPLSGAYTFAAKSIDTTGNESAYKLVSITLPDRRLGNVFDEFFEGADGWLGTKSGFQVQGSILEAIDATTWATAPATWAAWTRWNIAPTSPATYTTPARDFGTIVAGQVNSTLDADGTVVQELATSTDGGATWSAWSAASAPFSSRYLKLRVTVTANGSYPVPVIRQYDYQINAPTRSEYLNDIVISALAGSYRIGTGDIRIPLAGVYAVIKRTTVVIQDSSAGTWTWARIDKTLTYGPRLQFRLNGTLADPAYVDFFIEGY